MKKIDRYILAKFLTTTLFICFLFTIIAVAVDISEKADDFVSSGLSAKQIFLQYYLAFIPYIVALLFPLFVFIAVIFFTSKMALRSEIIAIIAGGTSFSRLMRPYWIGGVFLCLVLMYAANYVIPAANDQRTSFEAKYVNIHSTYDPLKPYSRNIYFRVDSFTYAGVRNYDTSSKSGGPFFMHRISGNQLVYNLRCESIRWDTGAKNWLLQNIVERSINGLHEKASYTTRRNVNFNFKPFDLSRDEYAKDKLNTPELQHFIHLEAMRGAEDLNTLKVEEYRRLATPLAVVILTLIGAIVASRKVRGGSGSHIALGIVLATAFILMDRFSTIFSTKGNLPPVIAAWVPDFVFLWVAVYLYKKAPK